MPRLGSGDLSLRPATGKTNGPNTIRDSNVNGIVIASDDTVGSLDYWGRPISERTQRILNQFNQGSRRVTVVDALGNEAPVEILGGLTSNVRVKDLGRLQAATGQEYSLLRGPNGERVLLRGEINRVGIPETFQGYKWSGHSHPFNPTPSPEDRAALQFFGQERSVIVNSKDGRVVPFEQFEDLSGWLP